MPRVTLARRDRSRNHAEFLRQPGCVTLPSQLFEVAMHRRFLVAASLVAVSGCMQHAAPPARSIVVFFTADSASLDAAAQNAIRQAADRPHLSVRSRACPRLRCPRHGHGRVQQVAVADAGAGGGRCARGRRRPAGPDPDGIAGRGGVRSDADRVAPGGDRDRALIALRARFEMRCTESAGVVFRAPKRSDRLGRKHRSTEKPRQTAGAVALRNGLSGGGRSAVRAR